jgi:transcriptional regulator with XRE-family HTH domain
MSSYSIAAVTERRYHGSMGREQTKRVPQGVGPDNKTLGERLRQLRVGRGLSQNQLARIVGTSNTTIHKAETARQSSFQPEMAQAIAEALGVDVAYLLFGFTNSNAVVQEENLTYALRRTTRLSEQGIAIVERIVRGLEDGESPTADEGRGDSIE